MSVLVDSPSFYDDILSGRLTAQDIIAGLGQIVNITTHAGAGYDAAYLDYMRVTASSVNPFVPSMADLQHMDTDDGLYWLRETGGDLGNASAWLKFAMAFWDGSVAGGIIETVGLALASASAGSVVMTALKGTQVVLKLLAAMKGLVGAALNIAKAVILSAAKTAFKAATVVAAKLWGAATGSAGTSEPCARSSASRS